MICTSVIPYLSSSLAKNNKTMAMFVQLFPLFRHSESLAFFSKVGGQTLHQHSQQFNDGV